MKRINYNPENLDISDEWKQKAQELTQALISANDHAERIKLISENTDMWRCIKPVLRGLFHGKCWYTEAPQQGTDVDVDHFRPKSRVNELIKSPNPHEGYWWLAFKLDNYRYSCIIANRRRKDVETGTTGGKADHFPICDENNRAWTPECDLSEEQPVLLDPCKASDVRLIMFGENGEALPRFEEADHSRSFLRANASIQYYHLNHDDFVKARLELRDKLDDLKKHAAIFYKKLEIGDASHDSAYEKAISDIKDMISDKAPYSSFCKSYMDNYKHEEYLVGVI